MKAVLYKDLPHILKLLGMMLLLPFPLFLASKGNLGFLPLLLILIAAPVMLNYFLFAHDPQCEEYLMASPIKTWQVAVGRYLSSWLLVLLGCFCAAILLLFKQSEWHTLALPLLCLIPILVSFVPALQIPFGFRFGGKYLQVISVFIYVAIFTLFPSLGLDKAKIFDMLGRLQYMPKALVYLFPVLLSLLLNLASFALSVRILQKKDCTSGI